MRFQEAGDDRPLSPVSTSFDPRTGIVRAHLDKVDYGYVDQAVRYQGRVFQPKSELRITIISEDAGVLSKYLASHPDDIDDVQDLVLSADWRCNKLDEFYHVVDQPGVETIIQMVELPGLRQFFRDLSKLVGQGFLLPPMHVTLYTRGTQEGIQLPDQQSFQQRVRTRVLPWEVVRDNQDARSTGPLGGRPPLSV